MVQMTDYDFASVRSVIALRDLEAMAIMAIIKEKKDALIREEYQNIYLMGKICSEDSPEKTVRTSPIVAIRSRRGQDYWNGWETEIMTRSGSVYTLGHPGKTAMILAKIYHEKGYQAEDFLPIYDYID